jgi:hypothetical protein
MPGSAGTITRFSRLRYRPIQRRDVGECLKLLPPWHGLGPALLRDLPALWERIIDEPSVISGVMEDLAQPSGQRVQGWGVTMILPQDLLQTLQMDQTPRAFLTREVYARLIDGRLQPMSDREIGSANAREGVTMFILHYSQRSHDVSDPFAQSIIATANDTFRTLHSGYNLSAIYFETGGSINELIAKESGFERMRYSNETELDSLPPEQRPAFHGLTRVQARMRMPGSVVRSVFEHQPPLFSFSASQRRMLWWALFDESDDAIMEKLSTSVHGLKKHWRGIYERIEDRMPDFFGEATGADDGKRGPEKRRQVLAYLRQRPEDLRPWYI